MENRPDSNAHSSEETMKESLRETENVIPIVEEAPLDEQQPLDPDEIREKWLRARAELENLRKRTGREIELARKRERETLLLNFIQVIDNFERALDTHGAEGNPWLEGIEGIRLQMLDVLKQADAQPFDAIGEQFDTARHHAVAAAELDGKPSGRVVEVTSIGYEMNDGTILRPAQVIVAK